MCREPCPWRQRRWIEGPPLNIARPCLDCGALTYNGRRCPSCARACNRRRNNDPKRAAYRAPGYRAMILSGRCAKCGSGQDLTRDHIIPLVKGGTNDPSNIRIVCRSCNSRKGAKVQQNGPSVTLASHISGYKKT